MYFTLRKVCPVQMSTQERPLKLCTFVFFCICVFNPEKGVSSPKVKAKGDSVVGPFPNMGTTSVR